MDSIPEQIPGRRQRSMMSSCLNKRAYKTYGEASKAQREMNYHRAKTKVFRCPYCHDYHLANLRKKEEQFDDYTARRERRYGIRIEWDD
jgi:hypothetical protein